MQEKKTSDMKEKIYFRLPHKYGTILQRQGGIVIRIGRLPAEDGSMGSDLRRRYDVLCLYYNFAYSDWLLGDFSSRYLNSLDSIS